MGVISNEDWSLDRQGQQAQARHKKKVKEAIKANLSKYITDEALIGTDGQRIIRVPIQSLDEPHFYYNRNRQQHVGQGQGEKGDVIAEDSAGNGASGTTSEGGTEPGERVYEAEITLDEVEDMLFQYLRLPNMQPKAPRQEQASDVEWTDIRKKGIHSNLDRKRTYFEALKRSRRHGESLRITEDDLRFKTWEEEVRPRTGAVILAMMDVSGSMGTFEKYVARTFFFWTERFLKKNYPYVEARYLVHHVAADEVSQEEFYRIRESGGTCCSSVYDLALKVVEKDYPGDGWNIYPIHVSDGDNASQDNHRAIELFKQLRKYSAQLAYLEVQSGIRVPSSFSREITSLAEPGLRTFTIHSKDDILKALCHFFREEEVS